VRDLPDCMMLLTDVLVRLKITVFLVVMVCSQVEIYRRSWEISVNLNQTAYR